MWECGGGFLLPLKATASDGWTSSTAQILPVPALRPSLTSTFTGGKLPAVESLDCSTTPTDIPLPAHIL